MRVEALQATATDVVNLAIGGVIAHPMERAVLMALVAVVEYQVIVINVGRLGTGRVIVLADVAVLAAVLPDNRRPSIRLERSAPLAVVASTAALEAGRRLAQHLA